MRPPFVSHPMVRYCIRTLRVMRGMKSLIGGLSPRRENIAAVFCHSLQAGVGPPRLPAPRRCAARRIFSTTYPGHGAMPWPWILLSESRRQSTVSAYEHPQIHEDFCDIETDRKSADTLPNCYDVDAATGRTGETASAHRVPRTDERELGTEPAAIV